MENEEGARRWWSGDLTLCAKLCSDRPSALPLSAQGNAQVVLIPYSPWLWHCSISPLTPCATLNACKLAVRVNVSTKGKRLRCCRFAGTEHFSRLIDLSLQPRLPAVATKICFILSTNSRVLLACEQKEPHLCISVVEILSPTGQRLWTWHLSRSYLRHLASS